ncbi:N4-gp56 family major capsid protein [Streptomyces sp. NPDC087850]|uniref:N4-gp56 family major capsid protein n=1 Tax=Streptomyces sp. NPDC087850 TaxID=3365809 RepID=UPI0038053D43
MPSAITGTGQLGANPTAYPGSNSQLTPAIQTIWSKEILFQSMPILRYEQFAVKKTELGVAPGLQINFMRYNNLEGAKQLVEGVRMETQALSASQFSITVAEHGAAVAVSELLLNASFDDVMASASRLLGRNMAIYLDGQSRDVLLGATSVLYGRDKFKPAQPITNLSPYDKGVASTGRDTLTEHYLTSAVIKDGVETLATKNIPRLGDTYVCFIHPHQSRWLREDPSWIEATKYAQPGNFSLGEIGRIDDVIFIETTQIKQLVNSASKTVYQSSMIGDNSFGHAISLPVELRDGGVLDYGREHALAWYSIYGMGMITDQSVVTIETN